MITTTQQVGGERLRMTRHVESDDDPETRCVYDFGPFLGGRREKQYPGDTYL